ncbi:MAG: VOC family protein [Proteobacteria bacterium]|nr:VOC family protein [Pseudomonadota bacterium]MDA0927140.1 VOC family protein [Pseudomonadota bacterium]
MFSHVMLGSNDMEASKKFYDATLSVLGIPEAVQDPKGRVFYRSATGTFGLSIPINGEPACHGNGSTLGFAATSPEQVDAWHAAGLENGGVAIEDPPGVRESATMKLYIAYLRDPTGNKVCALYRYPMD